MSKGYWVVRANVNDADEYSKYIQIATNIIEKYDGRFLIRGCLLYTSPSPRDLSTSRMPSSA